MRVFVAGSTGAIGQPLVRRLISGGHEVTGLTRSEERARRLVEWGATPAIGDVLDAGGLATLVRAARPDVVMHQVTRLPASLRRPLDAMRAFKATNRVRTEGTANLVAAAEAAGASRLIAQSIAFSYRAGPGVRSEDDPLDVDAPGIVGKVNRVIAELEDRVLGSAIDGVVLRYGMFTGPGTFFAPDGPFTQLARRRLLPVVGDGGGQFNFVHVDDAAAATVDALTWGPGVYNVAIEEAVPAARWIPAVAERLGAKPPRHVPKRLVAVGPGAQLAFQFTEQAAVTSERARAAGWSPARETFEATVLDSVAGDAA